MNKSEAINELASALAAAQLAMRSADKDGENPHFRSSYSTLASVWDAIRIPLSSNGLSVVQSVSTLYAEGRVSVSVETTLLHSSGQWVASSLELPVGKPDAQGIGSAITYGRRYGISALVGATADDDDDGSAASADPVNAALLEQVQRCATMNELNALWRSLPSPEKANHAVLAAFTTQKQSLS